MSETEFTPGNWIVVPYGDGDQLVICSDDENWRIAFMATPGRSPGAMEKIKADANLLAASKDLYACLAACDAAIRDIKKAFGAPGDYGYGTPQGDSLFHAYKIAIDARRALARARGKEK